MHSNDNQEALTLVQSIELVCLSPGEQNGRDSAFLTFLELYYLDSPHDFRCIVPLRVMFTVAMSLTLTNLGGGTLGDRVHSKLSHRRDDAVLFLLVVRATVDTVSHSCSSLQLLSSTAPTLTFSAIT
jgi:hypothetical protein